LFRHQHAQTRTTVQYSTVQHNHSIPAFDTIPILYRVQTVPYTTMKLSLFLSRCVLAALAGAHSASAWTTTRTTNSERFSLHHHHHYALHHALHQRSSSQIAVSTSGNPPPTSALGTSETMDSAPETATALKATPLDWDWPAVAQAVFTEDTRPVLLFDGVCNFCNAGVNTALDLDTSPQGVLRYASLQSHTGQALLMQHGKAPSDLSSVVLVESLDRAYFESQAVLRTAELLPGFSKPVRWLFSALRNGVPDGVRNAAYHVVARNRYLAGERASPSCRLDFDGSVASRFVDDPLILPLRPVEEGTCL